MAEKQLKVFTTGTTIVPMALARMVGNAHHVGQAEVYVSAATKAEAIVMLRKAGLSPVASRMRLAEDMTAAALAAGDLFTERAILIAHNSGTGPIVQTATDRGSVVIGEIVASRNQTVMVGDRSLREFSYRFVPAAQTRTSCTTD